MEANSKELVSEAFCEVLENLAFMFGEVADTEDVPASAGGQVLAAMSFSGPMCGRIELAVPRAMRVEIAANVLGVDTDDEQAMASADDALKELLNVTCGQLLTRLAGEEPVFDLSVPVVSELDDEAWARMAEASDAIVILVDENPALLRLAMSE
ncbi:MAG TPA: chemotaxis protein CheX [Candidatus Hydrogenedentes bacterium]|nr:chemotaxis protein CheX [Candidatus Hydrogenedentota bacterium]HPG67200.1 chemotaxis protein CheX [Candidatus Hydrogenedentota bacterium]